MSAIGPRRPGMPSMVTGPMLALGAVAAVVVVLGTLMAFGVLDVLAPLRLNVLGASGLVIGATFLASAAIESALSPVAGRLSDRRGALWPIQISLTAAIVVSLLAPLLAPAPVLVVFLIVGVPAFFSAAICEL